MAHWGALAMLVVTGMVILSAWAFMWCGLTCVIRRITFERLYPWAPRAAIPKVQAMMWPAMPLLGFAWIGVAGMDIRIASGRDPLVAALFVALLFVLVLILAVLALCDHKLPDYCYPGWRAKRYYLKHPECAKKELDAPTYRHLLSIS